MRPRDPDGRENFVRPHHPSTRIVVRVAIDRPHSQLRHQSVLPLSNCYVDSESGGILLSAAPLNMLRRVPRREIKFACQTRRDHGRGQGVRIGDKS